MSKMNEEENYYSMKEKVISETKNTAWTFNICSNVDFVNIQLLKCVALGLILNL